MKLSEVFEMLQYGELANVSISGNIDDEEGGIRSQDFPVICSHLNLALSDLHTRFNIKQEEVIIQQHEGIAFYELSSQFAQTNDLSTEPVKYIMDTVIDPFTDDVIRINAVFDEYGREIPINDENIDYVVYLSNYKTIQVPYPDSANAIWVVYRANHPKIDLSNINLNMEIDIPIYCVEALLSYVASRVHSQRTSPESQSLAVNLMSKYNMICDQIEEKNVLHNSPSNTNFKLGERGWV